MNETKLHLNWFILLAAIGFVAPMAIGEAASEPSTLNAQLSTFNSQPQADPGVLQPLLDGLLGKYGWLTTVLLVVGSLRILFKPIMLVVENAVRNDPVKAAAIQEFEAGPVYKTIAMVLDVGASIKLPLVKPPGPGRNDE